MSGVENNSAVWTDEEIELEPKERNVRPRPQETKSEIDDRGAFVRQPNRFRTPFGDKEGELKAERDDIDCFGQRMLTGQTERLLCENC